MACQCKYRRHGLGYCTHSGALQLPVHLLVVTGKSNKSGPYLIFEISNNIKIYKNENNICEVTVRPPIRPSESEIATMFADTADR